LISLGQRGLLLRFVIGDGRPQRVIGVLAHRYSLTR
jgi:hypothetical protein